MSALLGLSMSMFGIIAAIALGAFVLEGCSRIASAVERLAKAFEGLRQ